MLEIIIVMPETAKKATLSSPLVIALRTPAIMPAIWQTKRPPQARGDASASSLNGLERSIPPTPSSSVRSSVSDINKPLPPTPSHNRNQNRNSSLYSTHLSELIDLYLAGASAPYALFSEPSRSTKSLSLDDFSSSTSDAYQDEKISISESLLSDIRRLEMAGIQREPRTEYGETKYRYSTPEPRSATLPRMFATNIRSGQQNSNNEVLQAYRDTLLPLPFTPISTKSPDLFGESIPLRGPKTLNSPPSHQRAQSYYHSPGLSPTMSDNSSLKDSRPSTSNPYGSPTRVAEITALRNQLNQFSWDQQPTQDSTRSSTDAAFYHNGSQGSSIPELPGSISARPAPAPYQRSQQDQVYSASVSVSSLSNSGSQVDVGKKLNLPTPSNWSPSLKPSNPGIPRVLRSEQNPAIGLSPYQALGPTAWDEQDEREQSKQKSLFGRRKNGAKPAPNVPEDLHLNPIPKSQVSLNRSQSSHSIELPPIGRSLAHASDPTYARPDLNCSRPSPIGSSQPSPAKANFHSNPSTLAKMSAAKMKVIEPSDRIKHKDSDSSNRSLSWIAERKQRAKKEKQDAWKEDMKRRITVVSSRDSIGLSGHSALFNNASYPRSAAQHVISLEHLAAFDESNTNSMNSRDDRGGREERNSEWI